MGDGEQGPTTNSRMEGFEKDLARLINYHSIENEADIPDFILAAMICQMIKSIGPEFKRALDWHGCDSVCHPAALEEGGT